MVIAPLARPIPAQVLFNSSLACGMSFDQLGGCIRRQESENRDGRC